MDCEITIENDVLYLKNFSTSNKDIVSFFSDIPEEQRLEKFQSVLLAGTVAFRTMGTTEKVDYIEKCFNNFHRIFDDKINEVFG